ncbi:hypothetical protein B0T17DRAFT_491337 [Bombardia bombarda]|uniref:Uncharacterized protein n=1 Tax=Bombardia bombarda TaxID=252184 RepID=A0AA39X6V5_9PEZI|nr:hypothetical protein B0T17DRAFT_491337 [Bombardia bombarda]
MFSAITNVLGAPLNWLLGTTPQPDDNSNNSNSTSKEKAMAGTYEPTVIDVVVVKAMLTKALILPPEIVDSIVDLAEYWPHTTTEIHYSHLPGGAKAVRGGTPTAENQFLASSLRTTPIGFLKAPYPAPQESQIQTPLSPPRPVEQEYGPDDFQKLTGAGAFAAPHTLAHPCRRIIFTIASRDQGWSGTDPASHGTYSHSWTWFEAGLERCNKTTEDDRPPSFDVTRTDGGGLATVFPDVVEYIYHHPLHPRDDLKIQCNLNSTRSVKEHRVVWSYTDDINESDDRGAALLESAGRGRATGDGKFVRELKLGDVVTVWAKARFPAWVNSVESVKVEVYWAV